MSEGVHRRCHGKRDSREDRRHHGALAAGVHKRQRMETHQPVQSGLLRMARERTADALQSGVVVSLRLPVAHLYEQFAVGDVEVVVSQMFLKHDVVVYYRATQTVCAVSYRCKSMKKR